MNASDREEHAVVRIKPRQHLIPAMLIALSFVVIFFILYEIVERTWFSDADSRLLHGLHITRGVLASVIAAVLVGWVIKRKEDALKRSEARYRAIVEDQTDLICRWLPDGTITFVNDSYCRYFGRSREELLGNTFLPLIPPEDHAAVRAHFRSAQSRFARVETLAPGHRRRGGTPVAAMDQSCALRRAWPDDRTSGIGAGHHPAQAGGGIAEAK